MSTPHERLIRTTFSVPFGEVHALVGGAVNARPLLFWRTDTANGGDLRQLLPPSVSVRIRCLFAP